MKFSAKIIFVISVFIVMLQTQAIAIEEINLQSEDSSLKMEIFRDEDYQDISSGQIDKTEYEKPLKDKVHDVFKLEVSDNEHQKFLFDNIMTKELKTGPLENIGLWSVFRGGLGVNFQNNDTDTAMDYGTIEARLHGDFRNKKTSFVISTRYTPQHEFSFMQFLFADVFIRHNIGRHNFITIGNSRTHTGQEGGRSDLLIPFFNYSQIGRNFGNIRKLGVRINGDYKLVEYDIGGYSSGTYFREFFPGAEFCGWINFKPLGKTSGKYGDLKIGAGLTSGRCHSNYTIAGGYARYKYKKFGADFEIANADGYNGRHGYSSLHARGYYTTLYYNLTKRVQLLARYDEFIPNCNNTSHRTREYSAGVNYFIKGQALKLILNYIFRKDNSAGNSHRILIGTQVLL